MFQPLSGPGYRVHKRGATVEDIRAEIQRRLAGMPSAKAFKMPAIIPADRGRYTANWMVESWLGVPADVQAVIVGVMRDIDVQEP